MSGEKKWGLPRNPILKKLKIIQEGKEIPISELKKIQKEVDDPVWKASKPEKKLKEGGFTQRGGMYKKGY